MSDIVERLRLQNDCLLGTGHDFSDVLLDAAAEIERLRLEVLFSDTEVRAKADEIERLRGLLREAVDGPVRSRVVPHEGNWIRRVREALGE